MPNVAKMLRTVTFRLTLRYAVLFSLLSAAAFGVVYFMLSTHLVDRTDESLRDSVQEFTTLYRAHGLGALKAEFERESQSKGIGKVFFRLLSENGESLASSPLGGWKGLKNVRVAPARDGGVCFRDIVLPGRAHPVRIAAIRLPEGTVLEVGQSLRDNDVLLERYREAIGSALAAMILGGVLVGWLLVRRAMAGVERVTRTATHIGRGDFARRVPPGHEGAEIEAMARAFNGMLGRIEALVREMEEVTTNIAHDLRSPLTRIRGLAEASMTGPLDLDGCRETAGSVVEECDRLVGMIDTMLEIARVDSGMVVLRKCPVDLGRLVSRACELFEPIAREKNIRLVPRIPDAPVVAEIDETRIQRAVANLLDNALKFTPNQGRVAVKIQHAPGQIRIVVEDTGPGVAAEALPRVFERFYRADPSRSTPGNGLGLPLARSFARAHGGDILASSKPGEGSVFVLVLQIPGS